MEKDDNGEADMSIEVDERLEEWTGTDDEEEVSILVSTINCGGERMQLQRAEKNMAPAFLLLLSLSLFPPPSLSRV